MPTAVALETLAASSAIATCRASGHSSVGDHDINAVPFGVSLSRACLCTATRSALGWSVVVRADSGATRRRQSEKRREAGRQRVGMGVPTSVCQDEFSEATFFRVAEAEARMTTSSQGRSRYRYRPSMPTSAKAATNGRGRWAASPRC